ncbi:alpha-amylase family glycosyl hydrolase [Lactobacillus delbrueckii subsp. bulgaricus]
MASDTKIDLRKQMIYSIFVRNCSPEGNFEGVQKDLDRTSFGFCRSSRQARRSGREPGFQPYAISDYQAINPEYGTMEDFKRLYDDVYAKGDEDHHRLRLQPHFPRLSPG